MKIQLQHPYDKDWKQGYLQINSEGRRTVILYNSPRDRSTTAYARYLLSIKIGRYLEDTEQVDHIDNDKTNDNVTNLQILTGKQNSTKAGLVARKPLIHGTLSAYRYCKCDICKLGKSLWSKGHKTEYYQLQISRRSTENASTGLYNE